jgi:hypothetical protein
MQPIYFLAHALKKKKKWPGDGLFSPLTDNFYRLGQLFSDLVSENSYLLASLASVLKNLSTPLNSWWHCSYTVRVYTLW